MFLFEQYSIIKAWNRNIIRNEFHFLFDHKQYVKQNLSSLKQIFGLNLIQRNFISEMELSYKYFEYKRIQQSFEYPFQYSYYSPTSFSVCLIFSWNHLRNWWYKPCRDRWNYRNSFFINFHSTRHNQKRIFGDILSNDT